MTPTVSICIPCYKSERFIRTAIESALAQTAPACEILVSDDHSPDRTYEIAAEYSGIPTVRVLRTLRRLTLGEHYRFLLEQSSGEYVCFLSHDDALMPRFLETMLSRLEDGDAMIAAGWIECDSSLTTRRLRGMALPGRVLHPPEGYLTFRNACIYKISFSLLSRRLLIGLPHLPPQADLMTDWYWAMMLGLGGKIRFVRAPLGYYRYHPVNASRRSSIGMLNDTIALLDYTKEQVGAEFQNELEERLRRAREKLAAIEAGASAVTTPPGLSGLKGLIKDLLALRYRRLPESIAQAERGIGLALQRKQHA